MKNITFLGDSLTAGYRLADPDSESVPALIQQKINEEGIEYKVYNGGYSGSTSGNGLYRLDHWLRRPIDAFVLELGINDFIRKVEPERTYYNLSAILKRVRDKNPDCRLAIMGMRLPKTKLTALAKSFNDLYPKLAKEFHTAYVPFYLEGVAGNRALNLADGLHPNTAGYQVIAEKIWPVIRQLLREPSPD